MGIKFSHSQASRYMMCGHSYKLHYVDRIRPVVTHAALLFGTALDNALTALLSKKPAPEVFDESFTYGFINNKREYLPTHPGLVYANADLDLDILTQDDSVLLKVLAEKHNLPDGFLLEVFEALAERKQEKGLGSLTETERSIYNLWHWICLRRKGHLMMAAFQKKVMPKVNQVLAVQEKVTLENEDADELVGYVDWVAELEGHGTVILDNKTSSIEYEEDAVLSSPQLSLYTHILEDKYNTRKAGYIVFRKGIIKNRKKICSVCGHDGSGGRHKTCDATVNGKRCNGAWNETVNPDVHVQIIINEIPKQTENIVLDNLNGITEAIKAKVFTRNLNSCSNWYGGKCPYFGKCYKEDMTGLLDMKEEKKDE